MAVVAKSTNSSVAETYKVRPIRPALHVVETASPSEEPAQKPQYRWAVDPVEGRLVRVWH
jgi:hypothetical protein